MQGRSRRRSAIGGPLAILALLAALLPAPVAATEPTQITVNQATANAIADLWFPSVQERGVVPNCSGTVWTECPGGVARQPSAVLRFTRVTLAAHPVPPDRFDVASDLVVETVDPIAITTSGIECLLTIDSSAGTTPTVTVDTGAGSITSALLGYNYLEPTDVFVSGLEPEDVSLEGTGFNAIGCAAMPFVDAMVTELLAVELGTMQHSYGPQCGVSAPQLLATCPWLTTAPATVAFGDQAVDSQSPHQQVTLSNVGPGYPYVIDIGQITIEGADAGDFAVSADTCSDTQLGNWSCTFDIAFTPSAGGARAASLLVPSNWPGSPISIALAGNGIAAPPASADVSVSVAAALGTAKAKGQITYTITVANTGPDGAAAVAITDSLPSGTTFMSYTASAGSCTAPAVGQSGSVSCDLGTLANGASAQVQIVAMLTTRKASLINTATVSATTSDPDLSDNTASVTTRVK